MEPEAEIPPGKSPNMAAIARAAGVGKTTVSLALRDDPRLRPETRRKIQRIAEKMGYRANAVVANLMAQLRVSRNPKYQSTIGILNVTPTRDGLRTNFTFRAWMEGLRRRSSELGYGTDEFWLHEPGVSVARLRQTLRARNIRGVIVAGIAQEQGLPKECDSLWEDVACCVVGIRPHYPEMHFACNDQYSTAMRTARELAKLGYTRPGLVIEQGIEENIDYRFSAGFNAGWWNGHPEPQVPLLQFRPVMRVPFSAWIQKHQLDVIVCTHVEVREWVEGMGLKVPDDVGLVHLDVTPELTGWSGMNQNNDIVGAFATDLITAQIHRNETGIPAQPKCMMTEGEWVVGTTLRTASSAAAKRSRTRAKGGR